MTPGSEALLAGAGLVAGLINAVAGGGSLVSFPALLAVGVPSVPANVTNTVALWPGYVGGAAGYRDELRTLRRLVLPLVAISIVGAVAGAIVLLNTPASVFTDAVPWLVLVGTLLFAVQPLVSRRVRARAASAEATDRKGSGRQSALGVLAAAVYGAYFGAGLGVTLLGVLGMTILEDLQQLNAIKNSLSLSINTVALVIFALFGPVRWSAVLVMAIASLLGGYLGSLLAQRLKPAVLRVLVIVLGVAVTIKLFLDL